jgi:hypothetical protein
VKDAFAVRGVERIGDLDGQPENGLDIQRLACDKLFERLPLQVLHGDKRLAFVLAEVVDGADVGMVERRSGACLTLKTFQRLRVRGELFRKKLQGYMTTEVQVLSLVDHTHSASA